GQVRAIAFDKTGTLTTGKPQVVNWLAVNQSETDLLRVAAALESLSEHPIGDAIVQMARERTISWSPAENGQAFAGQGITGEIDRKPAIVGKAAFVQSQVNSWVETLEVQSQQWEQDGKTVVWVAYNNSVLGIIAIADTVRPEAARAIAHLKQLGIEAVVMLTGDNERTAHRIAEELGVDRVYAQLLPEDKVKVIEQLQRQYHTVAMVGDGINDGPALAQASVGIAMGATGSDVAMETADIVLMADRLERLEHAIRLGRRSQAIVKQNITFALGFIILLLVANFASHITLPLGVIGHEGSTVLVTLSGLRLLKA
ncbi:MAG TPA: HAD-IC family P-type ATPase, partial [Cyanophyceae cyanobacterium]